MRALPPVRHDHDCRKVRRGAWHRCTCCADDIRAITEETIAEFGRRLAEIASADPAPPDELSLSDGAEVRATKSNA